MANTDTENPTPESSPARSPEETISILKPSMWRNQPFTFLLYVLLVASPAIVAIIAWLYKANVQMLTLISLIPCAFGLVMLLAWKLKCRTTELTITTRRCILRHGMLSRYTTEIRHSDIRNIQVAQTFWQRICGVGAICISSALEDDHDLEVSGLLHPDRIAETIRKQQS